MDIGDVLCGAGVDAVGVYEIDRRAGTCIVEQSCGRIDVQRGTDDNEDVGSLDLFRSRLKHGHALTEEHYERTEQRAVLGLRAGCHLGVVGTKLLYVVGIVWVWLEQTFVSSPWRCMTFVEPAFSWRLSTFCVMTVTS